MAQGAMAACTLPASSGGRETTVAGARVSVTAEEGLPAAAATAREGCMAEGFDKTCWRASAAAACAVPALPSCAPTCCCPSPFLARFGGLLPVTLTLPALPSPLEGLDARWRCRGGRAGWVLGFG